ncbi:uncharacterized protein LOC115216746 [Octopus sinensis]|uniref:Uncharacterized protein LOC115216746 n=1 Tax=Octopus sinensis TaxID=2607531 RepID=A0A6P7SV65_9MOLL|nr:uncharacterized protein LOC115216746 [Octopus sinensis]
MSEGKDMFPRSTIQEANRHLQALYHRVDELESIINEQQLKQLAADEAFKEKINEINRSHDTEVKVLDMRLRDLEKDVETLTETIHQKDFLLEKLTYQCQHLETILGYQSSLRDLLETMESSSISVDSARMTRPLSENSTSLKNGDIENSSPFPSSSSSSSHKAVLEYSVTEFSDNESPVNERKKKNFTTKDKEYYL